MTPENLSNGNLGHLVSYMAVNHLRVGAEQEAEKQEVRKSSGNRTSVFSYV